LCFSRGKLSRRESRDLTELVEMNRRIEGNEAKGEGEWIPHLLRREEKMKMRW
jgi:hypothetical protein